MIIDALSASPGKLNWVCAVPAQEQIGLVLEWEVVAPQTVKTAIQGLTS